MLWLGIHLALLPLEIHTRGQTSDHALVVAEAHGQKQTVLLANTTAQQHGIQPGISVSSAYALAHDLRVVTRDLRAERAALEQLAAWAGQFTSLINLVSPYDVVLEIGGSLTLYGGMAPLLHALRAGLAQLGYSAALAVAPTPLAATWCARAHQEIHITDITRLTSVLAALPLQCAAFSEKQIQLLHGMGVQRLGDCLRLPRAGFARRLGSDTLLSLDRALGKLPDPRLPYTPPSRYQGQIALPSAVNNTEALLFALQRLLYELHGLLSARALGTQRLALRLKHTKAPATCVELNLVAPARDVKHLLDLFRERLQRVQLPGDVEALTLRAHDFVPLGTQSQDLFANKQDTQATAAALIERLQARLGANAVHNLSAVAEHRPEYAWRYSAPGEIIQAVYFKQRPVWLLPQPLPLEERDGLPYFDSALQLEQERERIESGWWDEHDIARDYFVAHNTRGVNLWVFRELTGQRRWMLHGVFG